LPHTKNGFSGYRLKLAAIAWVRNQIVRLFGEAENHERTPMDTNSTNAHNSDSVFVPIREIRVSPSSVSIGARSSVVELRPGC